MDVVFLIARILFVPLFITSGLAHFKPQMIDYARAMGAPNPDQLVPFTGGMIIAGGISVALGIFGDIGSLLLLAFLVGITPIMHPFWKIEDPEQKMNQQINFMKNVSMAGGALLLFWIFNQGQDLPLTITNSLLGAW